MLLDRDQVPSVNSPPEKPAPRVRPRVWTSIATFGRVLFRSLGFASCLLLLFILLFQMLRLVLYVRNRDMVGDASLATIAASFRVGLRFDLAVAAYATAPLLVVSRLGLFWGGTRGERCVYALGAVMLGSLFVLLGLGELEFYREFFSRYNTSALMFWNQPGVPSMLWNGYPVVRYLLVGFALSAVFGLIVFRLARSWLRDVELCWWSAQTASVIAVAMSMPLLVLAARGNFKRVPVLKWGYATHSDSAFANQLAQNGIWTLGNAAMTLLTGSSEAKTWRTSMSSEEALERTRRLLLLPHEELAGDSANFPLLRRSKPCKRSVTMRAAGENRPNVVLIIMESHSARFVGAAGSDNDRSPELNRLARDGIFFDRCFSNGSHTHQCTYISAISFPTLPGYEFLMRSTVADQKFDTLPSALKRLGYQTMFLSCSDYVWDNAYAFFKNQGIDSFIGSNDYDPGGFHDATWGVSDRELFERANQEFARARTPFFAMVLTASNHPPFNLPKPLPFPEVTDCGEWNQRVNGILFADWSIGHFFELARKESYFASTLFVVVGDHGFNMPPQLTEVNLLRYHVPLLFYAPELLGTCHPPRHTVASQLDIVPTILGLLGDDVPHQHWGRDLFALADDDPGFALFKISSNEDLAGFVRGNTLLVKTNSGERRLYTYDLGFPAKAEPLKSADGTLFHELDRDMRAYIQAALEVLTAHHAAP